MSGITPAPIADYLATLGRPPHPRFAIMAAEGHAGDIPIVYPETGALLHALVRANGARRVLEIGTAIGYSTLWMATALPADGQLISLEQNADRATRAREHLAAAGHAERVSVVIGDATRFLHKIAGPFDLIFQDSDKTLYEPMLDRLWILLRPGGVLATDNVIWSGDVVPGYNAEPAHDAASTTAIVAYNRRLADDPRFYTTFLPVGDGVALSVKVA